ncbi:hypothetical protein BTVI_75149 [Pitangus sulphuratus]|nr:hypothetical protein BTVI_75149 [Pitangus sulphuratus]
MLLGPSPRLGTLPGTLANATHRQSVRSPGDTGGMLAPEPQELSPVGNCSGNKLWSCKPGSCILCALGQLSWGYRDSIDDKSLDYFSVPNIKISRNSFIFFEKQELFTPHCAKKNHESQHQKKQQYNFCTGLDVPKLAPIHQSKETHP